MNYIRGISSILGLAAISSGCSPQEVKFPDHVGFFDKNEQTRKEEPQTRGAVKVIEDKLKEEILDHTVRIDVTVETLQYFGSIAGMDIGIPRLGKGVGSGISLCGNYVLTAAHNIPGDTHKSMKVTRKKIIVDKEYNAEVVKSEAAPVDLALLKVECNDIHECLKPYMGGFAEKVEIGDLVAGAGFPIGGEKTLFMGFAAGDEIISGKRHFINIDASISKGNSGGPAFAYVMEGNNNMSSHFIGIVHVLYKHKTGLAGITPLEKTKEFLKGSPAIECWEDLHLREL